MRLKTAILATCMLLLAFPSVTSCSNPPSVPSSIPNQPVEIVSFTGFMNPGPNIEIIVKNVSNGPIFHLVVGLDIGLKMPPGPVLFDFGFTQESTLEQGAAASLTEILSYGTFSTNKSYVLGIDAGVLGQGGASTYSYSIKLKPSSSSPITTLTTPSSTVNIPFSMLRVSANDLYAYFISNPSEASALYTGKVFQVSGIISDISDTGFTLAGGSGFVDCDFGAPIPFSFIPVQNVIVQGECGGFPGKRVQMFNCKMVN